MDAKQPALAYQAVKGIADNHSYKRELARRIREIGSYSKEKLNELGIIEKGKINAKGLFEYINTKIAKPLLSGGGRNFDSNDAGFYGRWLQVKTLVERYGVAGVNDGLLDRLVAEYQTVPTQYIGQKDIGYAGVVPLSEGTSGVKAIAKLIGREVTHEGPISNIREPTDVQNIKGEFEPDLVRIVEEAADAGKFDKIVKAVKG